LSQVQIPFLEDRQEQLPMKIRVQIKRNSVRVDPTLTSDIPMTRAESISGTQKLDKNDIGVAIRNLSDYTDSEKVHLLEKSWSPPSDFQWPYTEHKDGQKIRQKYLGSQHLSGLYQCFSYSLLNKGVYCKPRAIFAPTEAGGSQQDRLVKSPLQNIHI